MDAILQNGAISFIESMDASSLSNITQSEFESFVSAAILALPVHPSSLPPSPALPSLPAKIPPSQIPSTPPEDPSEATSPVLLQHPSIPLPVRVGEEGGNFWNVERIVSKPLGAIGRIFDSLDQTLSNSPSPSSPYSPTRRQQVGQDLNSNRGPRAGYYSNAPNYDPNGGVRGTDGRGVLERPSAGQEGQGEGTIAQVTGRIDKEYEDQRIASLEVRDPLFSRFLFSFD